MGWPSMGRAAMARRADPMQPDRRLVDVFSSIQASVRGRVAVTDDDNDFDAFYAATYGRLVGQLYAITGDRQEAEDAVQEAFARAVDRWPRLRRYDMPEAWVRRVAVNLASQGFHRMRRRVALLARLGPPARAPDKSIEGLVISEALRGLSLAHRQVLVLHHAVGLPVDEVARQLGVPVGTVKARLSRGRATLAKRLTAAGEEVGQHG